MAPFSQIDHIQKSSERKVELSSREKIGGKSASPNLYKINTSFSRYLFHSPIYRKCVFEIAQGSTRYNLSKGSSLKPRVTLPQLSEQQKIASCLSSLDALITAQANKIDQLQQHKKGLMQGLFPRIQT